MISPDIHILTADDLDKIKKASFARGVERGKFELGCEQPFTTAVQIIELGCHLFWGRNGDATHMSTDEFQAAHLKWYERASEFVKGLKNAPGAE